MRMSRYFGLTLRELSSEIEVTSHRLLLQAGYLRQVAAGIFSYLPLARRVMTRIERIMREEINAIGGQEVTMPVVQPASLWLESGRWHTIDREMGRMKDRAERDMALAMTHEEALTDMARAVVSSYRQLPQLVYHIQTKWRDDPRPRAGLIRAREFTMLDSYSLDADEAGLAAQYEAHYDAYFRIFQRCGLDDVIAVEADSGMMGGSVSHEYMALADIGEDTIILCDTCGYTANRQVAVFHKSLPGEDALPPGEGDEVEEPLPVEKVATPHASTIESLAEFLSIPTSRTAKALLMMATFSEDGQDREKFVFVVIRGDMEMNETKLANALKARSLRPAAEDEIRASGAVPGYASPVGLEGVLIVVDDAVVKSPNLVAGANEEGYHLLNVNYGRDYEASIVADIAAAEAGLGCAECRSTLRAERGIEVGNIFQLGTYYSANMGAQYTAEDGQQKPIVMGSYGIGVGRLMQTVVEKHHDDYGIIWPRAIAPYDVHLVALGKTQDDETVRLADQLYDDLRAAGIEVLYDDRLLRPGVMFNDADLIGVPLRVTVSGRSLEAGGYEVKWRHEKDRAIIAADGAAAAIRSLLSG